MSGRLGLCKYFIYKLTFQRFRIYTFETFPPFVCKGSKIWSKSWSAEDECLKVPDPHPYHPFYRSAPPPPHPSPGICIFSESDDHFSSFSCRCKVKTQRKVCGFDENDRKMYSCIWGLTMTSPIYIENKIKYYDCMVVLESTFPSECTFRYLGAQKKVQ